MDKKTIAVDFDGVIHLYREGWKDGSIYDKCVTGFFKWLFKTDEMFKIVIVSSRLNEAQQEQNMRAWLSLKALEAEAAEEITTEQRQRLHEVISFSATKPPAFITIDDRALTFNGDWLSPIYSAVALQYFRPWNSTE